jgi:Tfp pilus assembly protein PilV
MESMLASAVLAVSVVAVAGTMTSSYQQEQYALDRAKAVALASQTLEELAALPMESSNGSAGLADYADYQDDVTIDAKTAEADATQTVNSGGSTLVSAVSATVSGTTALLGSTLTSAAANVSPSTQPAPVPAEVQVTASAEALRLRRTIRVKRLSTLDGYETSTGNLAVLTVQLTLPDNSTVVLNRVVSPTIASAP